MTWWWINPQSEPNQMIDDVLAVTGTDYEEATEGLTEAQIGIVIADAYNKAEKIGVTPVQKHPNSIPLFGKRING